jgi:exonuclease VII large subunit
MQADIVPVLQDVCDVAVRTFYANAPTAGTRLAEMLREIVGERETDAVLVARGGGTPEQLQRLCVDEVKRAVAALTDAGKLVVIALGHGTFRANMGATVEAKVPNGAARVLRARLVDHPRRIRTLAAESQARIAALPVDDRFADEVAAEETFLRERVRNATEDHEAELELLRQPEV